mmetsp:Transcript_83155/g.219455  ORF Transcript_83155/g.219455 Transcript_83155/m.219455 type:complete len:109 (+) Transcript_83155:167-493(+)
MASSIGDLNGEVGDTMILLCNGLSLSVQDSVHAIVEKNCDVMDRLLSKCIVYAGAHPISGGRTNSVSNECNVAFTIRSAVCGSRWTILSFTFHLMPARIAGPGNTSMR